MPRILRRVCTGLATAAVVALACAGCGGGSGSAGGGGSTTTRSTTVHHRAGSRAPAPPARLAAAEHPSRSGFPRPHGRTLAQMGRLAHRAVTLGAATGTYTPGTSRFSFALTTSSGTFVYAPTAVYLARSPDAPARGPYLAAADPMTVPAADRSAQNAGPGDIRAIYGTDLPLPRAGTYAVLALTRTTAGTIGAPGEVAVAPRSPIPGVGARAPAVDTDTLASVGGRESLLTTRRPPEHMAAVSLRRVLGRRPVALLFSTPQLCTSRVCGPVTDELASLQHRFGRRITFIHQEVYVGNDPARGLRPALGAYHLRTEPWLFAIDRHGRVVARLEGAFGIHALTRALQAALR